MVQLTPLRHNVHDNAQTNALLGGRIGGGGAAACQARQLNVHEYVSMTVLDKFNVGKRSGINQTPHEAGAALLSFAVAGMLALSAGS
jgi:hypothetical protein